MSGLVTRPPAGPSGSCAARPPECRRRISRGESASAFPVAAASSGAHRPGPGRSGLGRVQEKRLRPGIGERRLEDRGARTSRVFPEAVGVTVRDVPPRAGRVERLGLVATKGARSSRRQGLPQLGRERSGRLRERASRPGRRRWCATIGPDPRMTEKMLDENRAWSSPAGLGPRIRLCHAALRRAHPIVGPRRRSAGARSSRGRTGEAPRIRRDRDERGMALADERLERAGSRGAGPPRPPGSRARPRGRRRHPRAGAAARGRAGSRARSSGPRTRGAVRR